MEFLSFLQLAICVLSSCHPENPKSDDQGASHNLTTIHHDYHNQQINVSQIHLTNVAEEDTHSLQNEVDGDLSPSVDKSRKPRYAMMQFLEQRLLGPEPESPTKENGQRCFISRSCKSGCCVTTAERGVRHCAPKTRYGDRCNATQVKGGAYIDFCPCSAGEGFCVNGICRE